MRPPRVTKKCLVCKVEFSIPNCRKDTAKYCSYICASKARKLLVPNRQGKKSPKTTKENHWFWRGENANYYGKHSFITRYKGSPLRCEVCGVENLRPRQYHWANVDHKYSRNLDDYKRMCVSCHSKYDIKNNNKKVRSKKLKKEDIQIILILKEKGLSQLEIANKFNVSRTSIGNVLRRKN